MFDPSYELSCILIESCKNLGLNFVCKTHDENKDVLSIYIWRDEDHRFIKNMQKYLILDSAVEASNIMKDAMAFLNVEQEISEEN